jgi:hypothetical protein
MLAHQCGTARACHYAIRCLVSRVVLAFHFSKLAGVASGIHNHACSDLETVLALQSRCFASMVALADSTTVELHIAVNALVKELPLELQAVHTGVPSVQEPAARTAALCNVGDHRAPELLTGTASACGEQLADTT